MSFDRVAFYQSIKPLFVDHLDEAIDIQSDFAERLQLVATLAGGKPLFMAVVQDDDRQELFEKVAALLPAGTRHGFQDADIHHRYRKLKIKDPALAAAFEERSIETLPVFWVGSGEAADRYESGNPGAAGDDLNLGYPLCCAEWHYDCYLARGPEAFAEVTALDGETGIPEWVKQNWRPRPGFFLPTGPITAGILRGNRHYPFLDHVACPSCIADHESPSARLNAQYATLAAEVDPECAEEVGDWCDRLGARMEDYRSEFTRERAYMAERSTTNVRARDAYEKHSRYLVRALGF